MFRYSYWEISRTLRPGDSVREALEKVRKGFYTARVVRRWKWPWQRADETDRHIIYIVPGEYTESLVVPMRMR